MFFRPLYLKVKWSGELWVHYIDPKKSCSIYKIYHFFSRKNTTSCISETNIKMKPLWYHVSFIWNFFSYLFAFSIYRANAHYWDTRYIKGFKINRKLESTHMDRSRNMNWYLWSIHNFKYLLARFAIPAVNIRQ